MPGICGISSGSRASSARPQEIARSRAPARRALPRDRPDDTPAASIDVTAHEDTGMTRPPYAHALCVCISAIATLPPAAPAQTAPERPSLQALERIIETRTPETK